MTLGILIPTLKGRRGYLARLMKCLEPQLSDAVKVYTLEDEGADTVGTKRQRLIETAQTSFVAHVDDDDLVAPSYCADVLDAIERGADVVGFRLRYYENGGLAGYATHSLTCGKWGEERGPDNLMRYTRTPNHLNPVRRELALQIGFKSMRVSEDADYSVRLFEKFGGAMNEVFVDKYLYDYFHRTEAPAKVAMYDGHGKMTREGIEKTIRDGGAVLVNGQVITRIEQLDAC